MHLIIFSAKYKIVILDMVQFSCIQYIFSQDHRLKVITFINLTKMLPTVVKNA